METNKVNGDTGVTTAFEDALKLTGGGKYNYRLLAISIYSLLAATAEMFTIGLVTTVSQCDLDLDVVKKGLLSSIPVLGVVVSAHFWGFLADTRGRRFSLIISTSAACLAGVIASFSYNWIFLAVIKFIGAIFASGTNAITFTFLGECTVIQKRQPYLLYASAGVLSFQAINAVMAYPILNMTFSYYMPALGFSFRAWRLFLLIIGLISGVNMLLIVFFTYESPKFYFAVGEHEKGLKVLQKIYKVNTGNATNIYTIAECDDSVADLTLMALAAFASYLTVTSLATAFAIARFGKKWSFVVIHVFTFLMSVLVNRLPIIYGIVALLGMTANVACMGIVTTYAVELFPTYMRAMAVCLCILSGRSMSIVFFNVIGAQLENNCNNFNMIIAGLILFGAIVGLFLPSDKTDKITEIIQSPEDTESDKNSTAT